MSQLSQLQHLLVCLSEECTEVQQAIAKALRFGLEDGYPGTPRTNVADIIAELNDLEGVIAILRDLHNFPPPDKVAIMAKRLKVGKYMDYAAERGMVKLDPPRHVVPNHPMPKDTADRGFTPMHSSFGFVEGEPWGG